MKFCKTIGWIDEKPKGYKETKKTSINVVEKLIKNTSSYCFWQNAKKKDDLSDVIIQAFAFYYDKLDKNI